MAIKPFNSVAGFSVGEVPANVILANGDITTGNANLTANLYVTNTANVGNLRTDNLLYANGTAWDFQEAAGNTWQIQYNVSNNFGASANFTYDDSIQNFTILGNANVTKTFFGNVANFSGNLTSLNASLGNLATANYINVTNNFTGNVANFSGNLTSLNASLGNLATANFVNVASNLVVSGKSNLGPIANVYITGGSNGQVVSTDGTGNLSFVTIDTFQLQNGNSNVVVAANSNVTVAANGINVLTISGYAGNAANNVSNIAGQLGITGNVTAPNFIGNVVGNISGNIVIPGSNTGVVFNDAGNANSTLGFTFDKTSNAVTANGNLTVNNANLGNLATANFVNVASNTITSNLTVNLALDGNTANFSGNVIVPNLTVNLQLSGNTANFTGNLTAANLIGALANGNSDIKIYQNANVEVTIGGTANVATFSSTGLYVAGDVNSTTGNITSNGSVTANGFLYGANANVTGQAILGSVLTANITAPTGAVTISAAGANENILLVPTGIGNVDVGLHNITQVATPVNPNDAATKEYVDNISQGLYIHPSANVTTTTNLNASYLNGGTVLSVTTITGGTTLTFSTNHGLSVDSDIQFTNSFNGIVAGEGYFVFSTPAANQITIKNGYFGTQITTLTNATGLTQPALGEGGVGATLTNAGAQAALTIDSVLMTVGLRVLVQGQTNQAQNGIYAVTTVGTISTNWVLTRASDGNSYAPKSDTQLGSGSYFFVTQGTQYAGTSYVLTNPPGEIIFGTSNITFAQFGSAGGYTAGNGIYINGTIISANVDLVTTAIVAGNITVKASANLTTPNIGDATFSSLTWNNLSNGNVSANNLSIGNVANIGSNLTVGGLIQANGNISSNAAINGNTASFTNSANVGGNLIANNITSNNAFSTNTANISSNLVTSNATVNLQLSGNTANFSGNIVAGNISTTGSGGNITGANVVSANTFSGNLVASYANFTGNITANNLTVNLELSGNIANFTGNLTSLNANLGNLATANFINVSSNLNVTDTANVGNLRTNNLLYANGQPWDLQEAAGSNRQIQFNDGSNNFAANANLTYDYVTSNLTVVGNVIATTFVGNVSGNISGNIVIPGSNTGVVFNDGGNANSVTAFTFNKVSNVVALAGNLTLANTTIATGTTTTSNVNANQTIVQFSTTGIAAMEFLVKGIDSTGSKYSVATVTAVTNGTNVDYVTYATAFLNSTTGSLAVNIVGSNVALQVTPASSNSTVWTTQVRFI